MAKKPWTDPNPQLGRPGIARQFAATEEPKPPGTPRSDTVEARRAAPVTGRRPVGAAPTDTNAVIADVHAMADKLEAERVERKRAKGRVVLPKPPALGKSTISTGAAKLIKASELKPPDLKAKRGRPATGKKPWIAAGVSKATYFRQKARGR